MNDEKKVKLYRKPREYLKKYPDGLMAICTSIPGTEIGDRYYGTQFLIRYGAWGFINISREPDYFGLYISSPIQAVRYFGVVDKILDPREGEHPVKDFKKYEPYESGRKLIILEEDSIIELDDEIPFEGNLIMSLRYTTLNKFIDAETTEDLWKE